MTTSKAEEDVVRSYDLSAASYITKPVTFERLVEVVRTLGKYWLEIVELPPNGTNGNGNHDHLMATAAGKPPSPPQDGTTSRSASCSSTTTRTTTS